MKGLQLLVPLFMVVLISSCTKNDYEDANKFVGTYSVSATEFVTWGGSSGTLSNSGILSITKISRNRVQTRGFFSTQGTVSGTSLYLEGFNTSDESGYIAYSFSSAVLSGNVITLTMYGTGKLGENGYYYPFRLSSNITAVRIN